MIGLNAEGRLRLLVTGSRTWDDRRSVAEVLGHYTRKAYALGGVLEVVHGAAVGGADHVAASWVSRWRERGYPVDMDARPARWNGPCVFDGEPRCKPDHRHKRANGSDYCPLAGHRRNQEMVDTRPAACVGFSRDNSSGTRDCVKRARVAGIPVLYITWGMRELVSPRWLEDHPPTVES